MTEIMASVSIASVTLPLTLSSSQAVPCTAPAKPTDSFLSHTVQMKIRFFVDFLQQSIHSLEYVNSITPYAEETQIHLVCVSG